MEGKTVSEDVMGQPSDAGGEGGWPPMKPWPQEHGSDEPEVEFLGSDLVGRDVDVGDAESPSLDLIERIRRAAPGAALRSSFIIGFPGETDAEFEETRALLERLPVTFYHVFRYSDREGTPAVRMANKVPGPVSSRRSEVVRALGREKERAFVTGHIGREFEGVVESSANESGQTPVMLDDYATVLVEGQEGLNRRRVRIRVDRLDERNRLFGTVLGAVEGVQA